LMMQVYGERSDTSGTRMTSGTRFEIQGSDQTLGEHGNYLRGNESSGGPCYNVGFSSAGLYSASSGDDVQVEWFDGGDNGSTDYTTGDAVGFSALNVGTLTGGPSLQQMHYHWRDDDDNEEDAASLTSGNEDTNLTGFAKSTTRRIRIEVSNEGTSTSASTQYRLEWGLKSTTCNAIGTWVNVDTASDAWEMYNTGNLTDGDDTTNIAESTGGVTDENTTFLVDNNAVKDTSATTAGITLASTEFAELEYAIRATSSATDGATYCFRVTNAGTAITSYNAYPEATLQDDDLTQIHYHWRNDDGTEAAATSASGGTDETALTDFAKQLPIRLRLEVSNEGDLSSASTQYRLEWGELTGNEACADISTWVNVDTGSDDWEMYNTSNLTDGNDTTNIAEGVGGVADENTTFLVDNNAVKDTSATTAGITLTSSNFVELEYSVQATTSATSGSTYCFRVSNAGTAINSYDVYPQLGLYLPGVIGESGLVTTDYSGTTVNLNNQYENPVVLAEPLSGDDSGSSTNRPAAAIITATTSTSFTVKIQEPDNETDDHGDETFSYIVMEEGGWTLPDSRLVDVGSLSTSAYYGNGVTGDSYADCNFSLDFATTTGHTITDGDSAFNNLIFNGSGGEWLYTDGTATAPNQTTVQNGTPTFLNAKTGTVSVTGGTLNMDWYLGTHVVDAENTSTDIDTGDNDVTFLEEGDSSTIWEHNGSAWGSAAASQTTGTNASGDNPQPNNSGAIRIREFSMTASASCPGAGCTLYRYNEQVAWTSNYGEYDYYDDYDENYLTSCWAGSTATCSDDTTDDDVIGVSWYRSTIGTMNAPLSTVNEPPTNGSWHVGMLEALSFSIDSFSRDYGLLLPGSNPTDLTNTLTATSSASHGYVIYARAIQDMTCSNNLICGTAEISDWSGTNASPTTWSGGSFGFGYSTNDYDLQGGTSNRFSGPNFAGFVETGFGDPVVDRSGPSADQENIITYRIAPGAIQDAGPYQTSIVYVIVATY